MYAGKLSEVELEMMCPLWDTTGFGNSIVLSLANEITELRIFTHAQNVRWELVGAQTYTGIC